jgi:hypothetical protein
VLPIHKNPFERSDAINALSVSSSGSSPAAPTPSTTTAHTTDTETETETHTETETAIPTVTVTAAAEISTKVGTDIAAAATSSPSSPTVINTPNHLSSIIGGVVGSLVVIGILGLIVFFILKRRRDRAVQDMAYADVHSLYPIHLSQPPTNVPWAPPLPPFREDENNSVNQDVPSSTGSILTQYVLSLIPCGYY